VAAQLASARDGGRLGQVMGELTSETLLSRLTRELGDATLATRQHLDAFALLARASQRGAAQRPARPGSYAFGVDDYARPSYPPQQGEGSREAGPSMGNRRERSR